MNMDNLETLILPRTIHSPMFPMVMERIHLNDINRLIMRNMKRVDLIRSLLEHLMKLEIICLKETYLPDLLDHRIST
jgi:hypothetical protein